jgi:hypothetical protein
MQDAQETRKTRSTIRDGWAYTLTQTPGRQAPVMTIRPKERRTEVAYASREARTHTSARDKMAAPQWQASETPKRGGRPGAGETVSPQIIREEMTRVVTKSGEAQKELALNSLQHKERMIGELVEKWNAPRERNLTLPVMNETREARRQAEVDVRAAVRAAGDEDAVGQRDTTRTRRSGQPGVSSQRTGGIDASSQLSQRGFMRHSQ